MSTLSTFISPKASQLQAPPIVRKAFITSSTTHTIPAGVFVARPYAVGRGSAGVAATSSGAGGGMAYGDIAVVAGDVLTINIVAGVAIVIKGGVTMLTANAATGTTGGTASINAAVTNGGAFSGGAGFAGNNPGGGSSGSPLGVGVAGSATNSAGGSGWGGGSVNSGGGGGVGGPGTTIFGGPGLTIPSFDPLLVGLDAVAGGGANNPGGLGGGGGTNAPGGFGGGGGINGRGGFGGGGGADSGSGAGAGGFGGGGGGIGTGTPGAGGAAAVLIFY